MESDRPEFFGEDVAAHYDELSADQDTPATVEFLAELARGGPALELAIGTGRVALPLAARGIRVDGIDLSTAMVARLRAKPGGDQLSVTIGDIADVDVADTYQLVFVVFNSLTNLVTQDEQVRCFENVAAHLTDDGSFVVESYFPEPEWIRAGEYVHAESAGIDEVRLDVCTLDLVAQVLEENHVVLSPAGVQLAPVRTRWTWPSELDLMARIAGLRLSERWAGWNREPFTGTRNSFVSVYRR